MRGPNSAQANEGRSNPVPNTSEQSHPQLPECRILLDPLASESSIADTSDLARVEDLLARCWRELDTADLSVKLTDLIRLLEFRSKLRPAADAESVFWTLIDQLRREELSDRE